MKELVSKLVELFQKEIIASQEIFRIRRRFKDAINGKFGKCWQKSIL